MRFVLVCTLIALTGCATSVDIANQSTKGNIGVEDAHNQVLLLNILRASKRRPMYFTAISSLAGPLGTFSPSTQLSVPFGSVIANNSLSTTVTADVNKFTVLVVDGQKFMTGITTPLKASTLKYYIEQGWPRELILSLLVRDISFDPPVKHKGETISKLVNYPGDKEDFAAFQKEIVAMVKCGLSFEPKATESPKGLGPALSANEARSLKELINATKEKLAVVPEVKKGQPTGQWVLTKPDVPILINLKDKGKDKCKDSLVAMYATTIQAKGGEQTNENPPTNEKQAKFEAQATANTSTVNLFIRSPEAILYYLGELVRACLDDELCGETTVGGKPAKIFNVERNKGKSFLSVKYDGALYSVTSGKDDRSSHSLSLVSQLIGLQKEMSELPQAAPIRVITQ